MRNYHLLAISLVLMMGCAVTPETRNRGEVRTPKEDAIIVDEIALKAPTGVLSAWLTYGTARLMWSDASR